MKTGCGGCLLLQRAISRVHVCRQTVCLHCRALKHTVYHEPVRAPSHPRDGHAARLIRAAPMWRAHPDSYQAGRVYVALPMSAWVDVLCCADTVRTQSLWVGLLLEAVGIRCALHARLVHGGVNT